MRPAPTPLSSRREFCLGRYLAEIRAEPLMNYCAWNEPAVTGAEASAAVRAARTVAPWPFASVREAAWAILAPWHRRRT